MTYRRETKVAPNYAARIRLFTPPSKHAELSFATAMRTAAAAGQCLRLTLLGTGAMAMSGAGGEAPPAYRYNLAMVTVLQNEAPFLPEWLEYHALYTVGVEHFYLYDDGSTDELAATLAPYLAAGLATLTNVSSLSPLPTAMEVLFERTPALPVPVPVPLSLTL